MNNDHATAQAPRKRRTIATGIEVFQLRKLGELVPGGDRDHVEAAFELIAQAARDTAGYEPTASEFKFTDDFATWSVTVNIDPIAR